MYKIKIFVKTSIKKIKKLSLFKNKSLIFCLDYLVKENNPNFSIIAKRLKIFINDIKRITKNEKILNNLINNLYVYTVLFSPAKKLKRMNFRAKGKTDIIEKRNSFITIVLYKKNILTKEIFYLDKKDYKIKA